MSCRTINLHFGPQEDPSCKLCNKDGNLECILPSYMQLTVKEDAYNTGMTLSNKVLFPRRRKGWGSPQGQNHTGKFKCIKLHCLVISKEKLNFSESQNLGLSLDRTLFFKYYRLDVDKQLIFLSIYIIRNNEQNNQILSLSQMRVKILNQLLTSNSVLGIV